MKTKILLTILLLIPVVGFILTRTGSEENVSSPPPPLADNNIADSFLIGVMWDGQNCDMHWLDSLGINVWHWYSWQDDDTTPHKHYPVGWRQWPCYIAPADTLYAPSGSYVSDIHTQLDKNSQHNM